MKRTHVLFAVAVAGLIAAFALPRVLARHGGDPSGDVLPPTPLASGPIDLQARPARRAILASGDDLDVVYDITAPAAPDGKRLPVDFALVLDRSGSMTGDPLAKAKAAAQSLVDRLLPTDRLAIVDFGSDARLDLPETAMDAEGKSSAHRVIGGIQADGGTNTSTALTLAENTLLAARAREGAIRRIVLLSDGEANEGVVGQGLVQLVRQMTGEGLRVSALGLGSYFDEDLMLAIADAGGGQYRYLRDADEVSAALTRELSQAGATAASGVSLSLTPADGVEIREVIGYQTTRDGRTIRLGLSDLAAGEQRHVVIRVHAGAGETGHRSLVDARLAYQDVREGHQERMADALASVDATTDTTRIANSYDKAAAKTGLQARWGGAMLQAMHAYSANDVPAATRTLKRGMDALKKEATAIGDQGLLGVMASGSARAEAVMNSAPASSPEGMAATKSLKEFGVNSAR